MRYLPLLALVACATPARIQTSLAESEAQLKDARSYYALVCAPSELAHAETALEFATHELEQGDRFRAGQHASEAALWSELALEMARTCGTADSDGDGVLDLFDACPDTPGVPEYDGCPPPEPDEPVVKAEEPPDLDGERDSDGDGLVDHVDACPFEPGPQEHDGCPDSSGDGVPDHLDACPDVAGLPEYHGCPEPEPTTVTVTRTRVELDEMIQFAVARSDILPESLPILDDVHVALEDHPHLHLRIEGHTDSDGGAAYNLRLSQARAESVKRSLVELGIEAERLEAVGYGLTRPIDTNRTAEGKARNRRVEFHIVQRDTEDR